MPIQRVASSHDQLVTSKPHRTVPTDSVQYTRDVLPPRPVSPRSTPYAQKVVSATLYQSSPSSFPSVSKPYVTLTEPIATRAYGGSRQTTTPPAEGILPTDVPLSETSPAGVSLFICSLFPRFGFHEPSPCELRLLCVFHASGAILCCLVCPGVPFFPVSFITVRPY